MSRSYCGTKQIGWFSHHSIWRAGAALCLLGCAFVSRADPPATDPIPAPVQVTDSRPSDNRQMIVNLPKEDVVKKATSTDIPPAQTAEARPPVAFHPALSISGDLYFGMTNVSGVPMRNNDGVWAGLEAAYPSNLAVNWKGGDNRNFRLALGVGDLYTGNGVSLRQPIEAYYQIPIKGDASVTTGKFYVPFATQEWEYEAKWGTMIQGVYGRVGYAASLNYDTTRNAPNAYLRIGRQWHTGTTLGLSMGLGQGVFAGTTHRAALGLDLSQEFKGLRLNTEYDFASGPQGQFQFAFGKLTFTRLGKFEPFIGAYYAHDQARQLTGFRSLIGGFNYRLTRSLALETGIGRARARNVFWFQTHVGF